MPWSNLTKNNTFKENRDALNTLGSSVDSLSDLSLMRISADQVLEVPGTYADINAALDSLTGFAIEDDVTVTINVASGTYVYTSPINVTHMNSSQIHITGSGSGTCILDMSATNAINGFNVIDDVALSVLSGFEIILASSITETGIFISNDSTIQQLNDIVVSAGRYGLIVQNGSKVSDNGVVSTLDFSGLTSGGIIGTKRSLLNISSTSVITSTISGAIGISLISEATLIASSVVSNSSGTGISLDNASANIATGVFNSNTSNGIVLTNESSFTSLVSITSNSNTISGIDIGSQSKFSANILNLQTLGTNGLLISEGSEVATIGVVDIDGASLFGIFLSFGSLFSHNGNNNMTVSNCLIGINAINTSKFINSSSSSIDFTGTTSNTSFAGKSHFVSRTESLIDQSPVFEKSHLTTAANDLDVNFIATTMTTRAATADMVLTQSNAYAGALIEMIITADGTPREITLNGAWTSFGEISPISIPALKSLYLSFSSSGTTDSDVHVSSVLEN